MMDLYVLRAGRQEENRHPLPRVRQEGLAETWRYPGPSSSSAWYHLLATAREHWEGDSPALTPCSHCSYTARLELSSLFKMTKNLQGNTRRGKVTLKPRAPVPKSVMYHPERITKSPPWPYPGHSPGCELK